MGGSYSATHDWAQYEKTSRTMGGLFFGVDLHDDRDR
jgi:hypothetical protein